MLRTDLRHCAHISSGSMQTKSFRIFSGQVEEFHMRRLVNFWICVVSISQNNVPISQYAN